MQDLTPLLVCCKMQDLTPLLVTPLLANVANNKVDTSLAVLSVAGGYLGVAACPTNGATCFIGATGITLGTDQLTKILFNHEKSYLERNLNALYSNKDLQMALPFIKNPDNATKITLMILGAPGGMANIRSLGLKQGNITDISGSYGFMKDLNGVF